MSSSISTHTLRKEGDVIRFIISAICVISTHTLRKEGDHRVSYDAAELCLFQPTPSARRVTSVGVVFEHITPISTHTLRKEGDH